MNEGYKRSEALQFINILITEIDKLLEKEILGSDFNRWYEDVIGFLSSVFGKESPEVSEFSSIGFIPPHELLNTAKIIEASSPIPSLPESEYPHGVSPEAHYYRERLHQARELLVGVNLPALKGGAS